MRPPVIQVHDTSITAIGDYRERICPIPPVVRRSTSPIQNPDRAEIAAWQEREIRKRDVHVADAFKYFGIAPVCHRADASAVDAVTPVDIDRDRSTSYRLARLVMNPNSHAAHRAKHCRRLAIFIEELNSSYPNGAVGRMFGISIRPRDAPVLLDGASGIAIEPHIPRSTTIARLQIGPGQPGGCGKSAQAAPHAGATPASVPCTCPEKPRRRRRALRL